MAQLRPTTGRVLVLAMLTAQVGVSRVSLVAAGAISRVIVLRTRSVLLQFHFLFEIK